MQLQHKDMMKGLLGGQFDDKIVRYFGELVAPEAEPEVPKAEPAPATTSATPVKKTEKTGSAKQIPSGAKFAQEDTKLGIGQSPPPPATSAPKTSTTTLREQSVSALGPASETPGGLPRTRPAAPTDPGKAAEPAPSVVIARPAIILTGDEPSFGSFSSPAASRSSAKKPERHVEMFDTPDTQLDLTPVGSRQPEEPPVVRTPPRPPQPAPNRLTGPIQAPPGLFKPESSKELPEELMHLNNSDTKVDDIILDFLMAESLSKLPQDDDPQP